MINYTIDKTVSVKVKKDLEDRWNKKRPKMGFCVSKFIEFCKRTDLHGYKYIVMQDLNVVERSCWALAVAVSIAFAVYFVFTAYRWYARNPIVTVIESTHGAIWDIPFPTVTICDVNVISKKAARLFANHLTLPKYMTSDNVFDILRLTPLLHSTIKADANQKQDLYKLQEILHLNNISVEAMFRQLSPANSCQQLVQRCMWKNTIYRCDLLFQQVFTHLNLCCAFNYYAIDTTRDNDTETEPFRQETPRRVASCGYQTALTVLLNIEPDDYYSASVASQGSLVFIDNAFNIVDLDSPVRMVNPSTEVLVALSPEWTYAISGIKAFSPEKRQCYYSDEVQIGDFRQYSYHNCIAFQKIKLIRKVCGCVPFFFPLKEPHRKCNFNDMECLDKILKHLEEHKTLKNYQSSTLACLPECEHYDYPLEVALGMFAKNTQLSGLAFFNDINLGNRSLLNVFFDDLVSTRYRRDVYLNWQNLLASFGGLLSLMLGFTLISGFDLIIFFMFRLIYDVTRANKNTDKGKVGFSAKKNKGNRIYVDEIKRNTWAEKTFEKTIITPEKEKYIQKWQNGIHYGNYKY